jgi:hypothetical protein
VKIGHGTRQRLHFPPIDQPVYMCV